MASTSTNRTPAVTTTSLQLCIQAGGGRLPINVETTLSIAELKQKIRQMTGIPPERQKWAVPPSGPITVENDGDAVGSVLKHKSTLHVQDCSASAGQPESQQPFAGHQWRTTMVNGTDLHQGDTIDPDFYGQAPQGRGSHMFEDTRSEYGALKQGDQYQSRNTFQYTQKQGMSGRLPRTRITSKVIQSRMAGAGRPLGTLVTIISAILFPSEAASIKATSSDRRPRPVMEPTHLRMRMNL
ncbi:hypothetical protein NCS52_01560700 [Fusarium sp. LHS14.1]|nr:hypothetical protein NCS52_01560700 [Fusarium sp. LHS14.1]